MSGFPDLSEQLEIVESFTRPAEGLFPVARLQHASNDDYARWQELAELGWLGISLPEGSGGIGLTAIEELLAAHVFGRHLLPPGFLATVVAIHALDRAGEPEAVAAGLSGAKRAAFVIARGSETIGIEPCGADWMLEMAPDSMTVFETRRQSGNEQTLHWGRPLDRVETGPAIARSDDGSLLAFARIMIAGHLAGIASETADRAVEFAKFREQFGQPIGAFQAVKHHCANMAISAYAARELATYAAIALAEEREEARALAESALNFAIRAARANAGTNIQVHGGIGFSAESDAHQFLKAAHLLEAAAGGISASRRRLAGLPIA